MACCAAREARERADGGEVLGLLRVDGVGHVGIHDRGDEIALRDDSQSALESVCGCDDLFKRSCEGQSVRLGVRARLVK